MVRKSSVVAVVVGCILLVSACVLLVWALHSQASGRVFTGDDGQIPWLDALIMNMPILGVACLWWPLVRRRRVPAHALLNAAAYVVGALCILCIVVILGVQLVFGDSESVVSFAAFYALTLVVHTAALCCFLRRPRLLLTWVLGVLLSPLFCACVYMLLIPRPQWVSEIIVFYVALVVWCGPAVAPLLGLPFAWLWVKRAEAKGRI